MAIDQETRDLIIRLDESVKSGFAHLNEKFDKIERKTDGHETRIRSLEDWRTGFRGGVVGVGLAGKAVSGLVGAAIVVVGYMGFQIAVTPKAPPLSPKTEQVAQP
jgi:hypothetical protein